MTALPEGTYDITDLRALVRGHTLQADGLGFFLAATGLNDGRAWRDTALHVIDEAIARAKGAIAIAVAIAIWIFTVAQAEGPGGVLPVPVP